MDPYIIMDGALPVNQYLRLEGDVATWVTRMSQATRFSAFTLPLELSRLRGMLYSHVYGVAIDLMLEHHAEWKRQYAKYRAEGKPEKECQQLATAATVHIMYKVDA